MTKHLPAMTGALALGLAIVASGPVSAGAIRSAPGLGVVDSNVIQVQERQVQEQAQEGEEGGRVGKAGRREKAGPQSGASTSSRGDFRPDAKRRALQRGVEGSREQVQRRDVRRQESSRNIDRSPRASVERRVEHRVVRRGWSRDRKHVFYGAILLGVPYGYAAYATHPCYDWLVGPRGQGYYWNYDRCPV